MGIVVMIVMGIMVMIVVPIVVMVVIVFHALDDLFRNRVDHLDHADRFRGGFAERFEDPFDPFFVFRRRSPRKDRLPGFRSYPSA